MLELPHVPVAQLDSSSGFLIRRSQVRILPGTPNKSMPYLNHPLSCCFYVAQDNYKQFQRLSATRGGSTQHECDMKTPKEHHKTVIIRSKGEYLGSVEAPDR